MFVITYFRDQCSVESISHNAWPQIAPSSNHGDVYDTSIDIACSTVYLSECTLKNTL